ncbi:beta-lactamase family protein [Sporosarcina sp. ACRSL]|uniref:serine hydrolase domain-containing protein n=1 Tax=Sporosarcina sp. ACRSL TaxID=2918215 RepID=UPI001EF6221B|nr:beta-lactamase family protein [Sporosarcina sp. ACRSL]
MKRKWFIAVIILFLFSLPALQVLAQNAKTEELHSYIETFLTENRIPGASISIVKDDEVIYSESFGVTGGEKTKVTANTPFLLGSISKSFTSLGVLKLVEKGFVHLDDPVIQYVPYFTLKDKDSSSKITVKQLLTQTSGISTYDGMAISDLGSNERTAIRNNVDLLSKTELTESPGTKHQYSNANYSILAALIEEVSGQSYSEFMDEQVFSPLEMKHAGADGDKAKERGYQSGYQSWFGFPVKSNVPYDNGGAPYGYITASSNDMVNYLKALLQKDEDKLVREELVDLAFTPHTQTGETRYYGFGWRITDPYSKEEMIWHSGSTPDSRTDIFFYPTSNWGAIILTNKEHILEEAALIHFRNGIISIMNGETPINAEKNTPIIQVLTLVIVLILAYVFARLLFKMKLKQPIKHQKMLFIIGVIITLLSMIIIPMLIYFTSSPWHSIKLFAPDVALLTVVLSILLFGNGILLMLIGKRNKF